MSDADEGLTLGNESEDKKERVVSRATNNLETPNKSPESPKKSAESPNKSATNKMPPPPSQEQRERTNRLTKATGHFIQRSYMEKSVYHSTVSASDNIEKISIAPKTLSNPSLPSWNCSKNDTGTDRQFVVQFQDRASCQNSYLLRRQTADFAVRQCVAPKYGAILHYPTMGDMTKFSASSSNRISEGAGSSKCGEHSDHAPRDLEQPSYKRGISWDTSTSATTVRAKEPISMIDHYRLMDIYKTFVNQDECLRKTDFVETIERLEVDLAGHEVNRVWSILDPGQRESIDFEDFCVAVRLRSFLKNVLSTVCMRSHMKFTIPKDYDYTKSTAENYCGAADEKPVGLFAEIRKLRDHTYHNTYTEQRQLWQDSLVKIVVTKTSIQLRPWLIFTAGSPGAGKGHVMRWMSKNEVLPLEEVVHIDPDYVKQLMPEWKGYVELDGSSAGSMCHKESGYVQEICLEVALRHKQNTWVDGSLADGDFYAKLFADVRNRFPEYRIAVFYVHASPERIRSRNLYRALETGRLFPENLLSEKMVSPWISLQQLTPFCDFIASIRNEETPVLESFQSVDRSGDYSNIMRIFSSYIVENEFPYTLPPLLLTSVWSVPYGARTDVEPIISQDIFNNRTNDGMECKINDSSYIASPPSPIIWSQSTRSYAGVPDNAHSLVFLCPKEGVGPDGGFGSFPALRTEETHGAILYFSVDGFPLTLEVLHLDETSISRQTTMWDLPYDPYSHRTTRALTFGSPRFIPQHCMLEGLKFRNHHCLQKHLRVRGARSVAFIRPGELDCEGYQNFKDCGFLYGLTEATCLYFAIVEQH